MNKILRTTIVCLLIPSFVFAQIPQYRANEPSVKQTDLSRVWNALNTEVGQQIITYIESTVGSINLEQAKAFITAKGEVAFVPIRPFNNDFMTLCYRQLENGSEFFFLLTYNAGEKAVSFTFPSGQMYLMKTSGIEEALNPDFQFQHYDDISNKVSINLGGADFCQLIKIICLPDYLVVRSSILIIMITAFPFTLIFCTLTKQCDALGALYLTAIFFIPFVPLAPLLLIYTAYQTDSNLKLISILFALYWYSCLLSNPCSGVVG